MLRLNGSEPLLLYKLPEVSQKPLKSCCCYPGFSKRCIYTDVREVLDMLPGVVGANVRCLGGGGDLSWA